MMLRTILHMWIFCIAFFLLSGNADAQKPSRNKHLEKGITGKTEYYRQANMRINAYSGTPVAVYRPYYTVLPAGPEDMARQYLRENAKLFGMKKDLNDLKLQSIRQTPAGYHVRFHQFAENVRVFRATVTVTINRMNQVTFVMNNYQPAAVVGNQTENISKSTANGAAKSYLAVTGKLNYDRTETILYSHNGVNRLAHQVTVVPAESVFGDWEILVDARTGEIFRVEDRAAYARAGVTDTVVTYGVGTVFNPDPLTRARALYGSTGFADNNDTDSDSLTAQLLEVNLPDIKKINGVYYLNGPYCQITDDEAPYDGVFSRTDSNFSCTRGQDAFEAVNTYFHIDRALRYINETLGLSIMPIQYTGGAKCDPHGLNGDDNSHYSSSTGKIAWGEGGVDDAEDEDVLNHELGHALHDWVTGGNLSQEDGLSEGTGDYWAASHNRSTGFWQPGDAQYHWVFQWDGHNTFWDGRITNVSYHYPEDLNGDIYHDGAMWSSTLMQVWNAIGKEATDKNLWVALAMTDGSSNQEDAAQAFVQADIDNYGGANLSQIEYWFNLRGYNVTIPTPQITHTPLTDTENLDGPFVVNASITASAPLDSVILVYGVNGEFTDTVLMTLQDSVYTDTIPGLGVPAVYRYYIIAKDSMGMVSTHPGGAPGSFHEFTADADTLKPLISHTRIDSFIIFLLPVDIRAEVTDNIGVDCVWVEYQINRVPFSSFTLIPATGDAYEGVFDFDTSHVAIGDTISYRIFARDASSMQNIAVMPAEGYYDFPVTGATSYITLFTDDFSAGAGNWTITNLGGSCNWEIMSAPYPNSYTLPVSSSGNVMAADADDCGSGTTILSDLTLANPISTMNFDSVRLEFDSDWRNYDAQDSAIVFVSADSGTTWRRVLTYAASVRNTHVLLDVSSYLAQSDEVKIRFRSIQPGWDWWWAIDNVKLSVKDYRVAVSTGDDILANKPQSYHLHQNYPNPFNPTTTIRYDLKDAGKVTLKIYNILGQEVRSLVNKNETAGFKAVVWDGKDNAGRMVSSGLYIYRLEAGKFIKSHKMMLLK